VCEILLRNPVDPYDEALWPTYFDWMRRTLETFKRVLGPRIAKNLPGPLGGYLRQRRAVPGILDGAARLANPARERAQASQASTAALV
jgi:hypothetical protein